MLKLPPHLYKKIEMAVSKLWAGSSLNIYHSDNGNIILVDQLNQVIIYRKYILPFLRELFDLFEEKTLTKKINLQPQDSTSAHIEPSLQIDFKLNEKFLFIQGNVTINVPDFAFFQFLHSLKFAIYTLLAFAPQEIYVIQNVVEIMSAESVTSLQNIFKDRHNIFKYLKNVDYLNIYVLFSFEKELMEALVFCEKCFLLFKKKACQLRNNK